VTTVVNLIDGQSLVGRRRWWAWPWTVVLTGARSGDGPPLDGRVVVPRHAVLWMQVV
jgi:hypothetical protein